MEIKRHEFSKSGPDLEDTKRNLVRISSNDVFRFVVEYDTLSVEKLYDPETGHTKRLSIQRQPIVVGNAYAITRDLECQNRGEELIRSLKKNAIEENPCFHLSSQEPCRNEAVISSNSLLVKNNRHSENNDLPDSEEKLSASSESRLDGGDSSEQSEGLPGTDSIGLVKSILGPSFEDAVLRTLEFGKSLIQKGESTEVDGKEKNVETQNQGRKEGRNTRDMKSKSMSFGRCSGEEDRPHRRNGRKIARDNQRTGKKRILLSGKIEQVSHNKMVEMNHVKPLSVAKIRSLDSELKQISPSPEKIKRQLEALIQINKDEPPECVSSWGYFCPKPEFIVMPTTVRQNNYSIGKDDGGCIGSRSTAGGVSYDHSKASKSKMEHLDESNSNRQRTASNDRSTKSSQNRVCQAPEYISNALGPTLDISIMDNLKLMRNLFKCDKSEPDGRGEPIPTAAPVEEVEHDIKASCEKVDELQRIVDELTEKQNNLLREIEEEEREREVKRRAFLEEEKRVKTNLLQCAEEERVREYHKRQSMSESRDCEHKLEALKCRIRSEEARLNSLKQLSDTCEMEINQATLKKEILKRNKSLLDAWDVIASRVCHTKLPSFSKVSCLQRKTLKPAKEQHCCFPQKSEETIEKDDRNSGFPRGYWNSRSKSFESKVPIPCRSECTTPYPLQRDIVCGMHRIVKTCLCNEPLSKETVCWSSEDDTRRTNQRCYGQTLQRSKSEIGRKDCNAKLCKVLWAVTRINIFQDNSRTYEVMDATTIPPKCLPARTEGVFVVKNPKKCCPEPQRSPC